MYTDTSAVYNMKPPTFLFLYFPAIIFRRAERRTFKAEIYHFRVSGTFVSTAEILRLSCLAWGQSTDLVAWFRKGQEGNSWNSKKWYVFCPIALHLFIYLHWDQLNWKCLYRMLIFFSDIWCLILCCMLFTINSHQLLNWCCWLLSDVTLGSDLANVQIYDKEILLDTIDGLVGVFFVILCLFLACLQKGWTNIYSPWMI